MGQRASIADKSRHPDDQLETRANIDKACLLLGYASRTCPREGLKAEIGWYYERIFGRSESQRGVGDHGGLLNVAPPQGDQVPATRDPRGIRGEQKACPYERREPGDSVWRIIPDSAPL